MQLNMTLYGISDTCFKDCSQYRMPLLGQSRAQVGVNIPHQFCTGCPFDTLSPNNIIRYRQFTKLVYSDNERLRLKACERICRLPQSCVSELLRNDAFMTFLLWAYSLLQTFNTSLESLSYIVILRFYFYLFVSYWLLLYANKQTNHKNFYEH